MDKIESRISVLCVCVCVCVCFRISPSASKMFSLGPYCFLCECLFHVSVCPSMSEILGGLFVEE